jgi:hypothetical protein
MRALRWFVVVALVAGAVTVGVAGEATGGPVRLGHVRSATKAFKHVPAAVAAGYEPFLDCFDLPGVGGMGQHYVKGPLDGEVDPLEPEALVYEIRRSGRLRLVGVEYVVPGDAVTEAPELFGQTFHFNGDLGVWVLHAWIWQRNPAGTFEDYNPKVSLCP